MQQHKNLILMVASTAVFFEALDIAIVNLAAPIIQRDLVLSANSIQWLQTLYLIPYGGFLILGGKLADTYGRKRMFLCGGFIFMLTSLCAGLSTSYEVLLFFRMVQGVGAALIMPAALSIISFTFQEPAARGKAMGIFSAFAAVGSGLGMSVGGLVATFLGWPWVFFINVPVIASTLWLGYRFMDNDDVKENDARPDILSAACLTGSIVLLSAFIHLAGDLRQHVALSLIMLVSFGITLGIFILRSTSSKNPLINFSAMLNSSTRLAVGVFVLLGAFFNGYLFVISIILQNSLHYSAAHAGLLLFPFGLVSMVVSKYALPLLLHRFNMHAIGMLGLVSMVAGAAALLFFFQGDYNFMFLLMAILCISGVGMAICIPSLMVLTVQHVRDEHHGVASSLGTTAYFLGGGLGLSVLTLFAPTETGSAQVTSTVIVVLGLFAVAGLLWMLTRVKIISLRSQF
ncbi:MFS transporter [Chryseolinea lacunae]|uniref:MFS transporter n=1 Tax=Chryseolinea lacunae TaxID=2801331 RepID=A0ABS1KYJ8_9BACT|nr:MFS transporter [Chryseolinea lacunae]MBL0744541.1 MFS transporter [Chryseolinea lacunae]